MTTIPQTECAACGSAVPNPAECAACERYMRHVYNAVGEAAYWRTNRYAPLSPYWPDPGMLPAVRGLSAA